MVSKIAVRVHSEGKRKPKFEFKQQKLTHERVLVFDTETSVDEYQNLKFGSFLIFEKGEEVHRGLFYSPENLNKEEIILIKDYCDKKELDIYTREEFVKWVFYPEVLNFETLCVGFNLPFDLSRLAIHFSEGKLNHRGRFSIVLTEDARYPRVKIKHIDSTKSFIQFGSNKFANKKRFKGYFLDLKTLSSTFADKKSITLRQAGESFGCEILKTEAEEHGNLNEDYLDYNINDIEATLSLYQKLVERYEEYNIPIPIHQIYSSASLGKYALRAMGIKPLSCINSDIDAKLKGELMTAYFGGRCEVKLRKNPALVTVLDFLSMYPSLTINMGLWDFITADEIRTKKVTGEIRDFLSKVRIEDLRNKELWNGFNVLVEVKANEDILPVRSNYLEDSQIYNVGINYLKNEDSLFYALPDVISSVLLTGKVPEIISALRFVPVGKQDTLRKTNVLGIEIDPSEENFIKKLIEKRQEIKRERNSLNKKSKEYSRLDDRQRALKILANSSTYGIFIEVRQNDKKSDFKVYGKDSFWVNQRKEEEGKFFNPLIAVMQIAGARLLLSMAEAFILKNNENHFYMDTDSCFVPSYLAKPLRDFFAPLNPYDFKADFFEIEKEDLLFYAISSKRYVLYKLINGKPEIIDYKLHGLGHILNPYGQGVDWQKQIWQDVLNLHYGKIERDEIVNKYSNFYCLSKLSVSTPVIYRRFKNYNEGKPLNKQIKPFNFLLVGQGSNKKVKPIAPFSKNSQEVIYSQFINNFNGEVLQGEEHWRPLSEVILNFIDHPESKFKNGKESGIMERRCIFDGKLTFIGKETKNIENQFLEKSSVESYFDEGEMKKKILNMTPEEAREKGVSRDGLWRVKERLRKNDVNWKTKNIKKLLE